MGTRSDVKHFDAMAGDFERVRLKVIPGYRVMEKLIFSYLPFRQSRRIAILELGTGPGTLALKLLRKFPRSTYAGIDFSGEMLTLAASRLKKYESRVKLHMRDLNRTRPEGSYDLIVSLFTIHHVRNKKRLFKHLFSLLAPGGCFFYGDVAIAHDRRLERCFIENWKDFMARSRLPQEKIKKIIADHRNYDQAESVERQLNCLKSAGFKSRDIVWSSEKSVAFFATK